MNGLTAYSIKPLRLATLLDAVLACCGFLYGLYTIISRLTHPSISPGYSSLMAVLLLIGGCLMLMMGLAGEYIGRIYISLNNSPQYVIRDEVNFVQHDQEEREPVQIGR